MKILLDIKYDHYIERMSQDTFDYFYDGNNIQV